MAVFCHIGGGALSEKRTLRVLGDFFVSAVICFCAEISPQRHRARGVYAEKEYFPAGSGRQEQASKVPGYRLSRPLMETHDSAVLYRTFVAERRLNLARPFQGRENRHHTIIFVASATIEMRHCSAVANATEYSLGLGYRGLKAG